ncbi:hypothetical protein [Geomonas anaerohicana]|uniref:Lipoprotein n=1 Tax=Geomonas anaerohicana TaxID=2798583 RepID=A0ABS0YEE6_9BACT|nr:hypothetical protein [Geomonas anaerohicana]MBJ6750665.1 hypothetical protein [Geomonas anaerohicana]
MKKFMLLVVALMLAACGGGGGSSVTDVNSGTPTGVVSVKFVDGAAAKTTALQTYENVRVVITNPNLRLNGQPFRVVADHPSGGAPFSFALPLANGYVFEALTYNTNADGFKVPADYAISTGVSITRPDNNSVSLALNPTAAVMSAPGVVTQGAKFSVMANLSTMGGRSVTPLQNFWYLPTPQRAPYVTFANSTSAFKYGSAHGVTAPIIIGETTAVKLYYQGVFTVKPNLLMGTETAKSWAFYAPSVTFGNLSTSVMAPSNVNIPLPQ